MTWKSSLAILVLLANSCQMVEEQLEIDESTFEENTFENEVPFFTLEMSVIFLTNFSFQDDFVTVDCQTLVKGQYLCTNLDIDIDTQQPANCSRDTQKAPIKCIAAPKITCK